MLYKILQWIMRRSLSTHYLEIKANMQKVPKTEPLLIAANHPNSFLDAIIIASLIDRPMHFLARSDVFNTVWSNFILRKLNLIPIYRKKEGTDKLKQNQSTFDESSEVLCNGGAILIFVEGISVMDMKLRPLKKGLGRIIIRHFTAQPNAKLKVVSIGINYDRPKEFRSKILVGSSEPITLTKEWLDKFPHPHKAIHELNEQIYTELQAYTIEVEDNELLEFKMLSEMDSSFKENSLSRKILIAKTIKKMHELHPIQASRLKEDSRKALGILKKYKLNFRKIKTNEGVKYIDSLIWLLLLPIAVLSLLINFIPFLLSKFLSDQFVKVEEFYASVRIVLNTILWLLFQIGITIYLLQFHPAFIGYIIAAYFNLKFYLWYREHTHYLRSTYRLMKLRRSKTDYEALQLLIKEIYRIRASFGLMPK